MLVTSKRACQWHTLVLLTIGLAVAVFAWGLHYKLSMYKSANHSVRHTVAAKLLTDRERSADTVGQVERAATPMFLVFCALATLLAGSTTDTRRQSAWLLQRAKEPRRRLDPGALRRLYSRPPPITQ